MTITFADRITANPVTQAALVVGFLVALAAFLTEEGSFLWVAAAGLLIMRSHAASTRIREEREWLAVKKPGALRKQAVVADAPPPARRGVWRGVALAFGHPVVAWPVRGLGALLLLAWFASGQRDPADNITAGLILSFVLLTTLAQRYRKRVKNAEALPAPQLPPGVLAADDANPVRSVVPALAPTPSVKEAMQALPPALYQLVFAGLKVEAGKAVS